jgi:hypothetical protein
MGIRTAGMGIDFIQFLSTVKRIYFHPGLMQGKLGPPPCSVTGNTGGMAMFAIQRAFNPFPLLAPVLLLAGCATGSGIIGEREIAGLKEVPSPKLMPLCMAYAKLKRYNKLFPCLDRLDENIRRGDKRQMDFEELRKRNPLMAGMAQFGAAFAGGQKVLEGDISPFPGLMRAEAYIDLGRYPEAVEQAKQAQASIPTDLPSKRQMEVWTTGMIGLAYALGGDRENALKTATQLENISTAYPYTLLRGDKGVGLAKIHLALGNYPKALEAMEQGKDTWFDSLAKGVADAFVVGETKGEGPWVWQDLPSTARCSRPATSTKPEPATTGCWPSPRRGITVISIGRTSTIAPASMKETATAPRPSSCIARRSTSSKASARRSTPRPPRSASSATGRRCIRPRRRPARRRPERRGLRVRGARQVAGARGHARVQGADPAIAGQRSLAVKLKQDLQAQAPELAALVTVTYSSAKDIQARLPADEALIEYYYDDKRVYAFVVARERLQVVGLEGGNPVNDVKSFREALEAPGTTAISSCRSGSTAGCSSRWKARWAASARC